MEYLEYVRGRIRDLKRYLYYPCRWQIHNPDLFDEWEKAAKRHEQIEQQRKNKKKEDLLDEDLSRTDTFTQTEYNSRFVEYVIMTIGRELNAFYYELETGLSAPVSNELYTVFDEKGNFVHKEKVLEYKLKHMKDIE